MQELGARQRPETARLLSFRPFPDFRLEQEKAHPPREDTTTEAYRIGQGLRLQSVETPSSPFLTPPSGVDSTKLIHTPKQPSRRFFHFQPRQRSDILSSRF
jgi:hypothetical protein